MPNKTAWALLALEVFVTKFVHFLSMSEMLFEAFECLRSYQNDYQNDYVCIDNNPIGWQLLKCEIVSCRGPDMSCHMSQFA